MGLIAGYAVSGFHHGAFLDVSVTTHITWIGQRSWLIADPRVHSDQQLRLIDHTLLLCVGYLFRL